MKNYFIRFTYLLLIITASNKGFAQIPREPAYYQRRVGDH